MPTESSHPHDRERDALRPSSRSVSPAQASPSDEVAPFEPLADPATISGQPHPETIQDARDDEVARLRSALHSRSKELAETLRDLAPDVTLRPDHLGHAVELSHSLEVLAEPFPGPLIDGGQRAAG